MMPPLRYVLRPAIDDEKWNQCIDAAANGMIYAKTFYLDAMAVCWSAVVAGDYEAVLPLPFKKKYALHYVYMPAFVQQLGCFAKPNAAGINLTNMLQQAQAWFSFGDYHINHANALLGINSRTNYVLPLDKPYEAIQKNYKTDLKKNLARVRHFQLNYAPTNDVAQAIALFRTLYKNQKLAITTTEYDRFLNLCALLQQQQQLLVRSVANEQHQLLATAVLLKDNRRLYLILSATTRAGRAVEANHFLIDRLIQEFAAQPLLLDFEGSDQPGIAHFYRNFGSTNEPYGYLRWNRLPWPLRLFKK